ncbi:hypothetical protein C0992_009067 [Termitomyces sp. T32_za158]|nr:hypothetical protein C0992_009067 [Termitomyces sp. T32_za158]
MAFLYIFRGKGGLPVIDFSNVALAFLVEAFLRQTADNLQICGVGSGRTFAGSDLTDCSFLESDIRTCQAKGKIVTLSLGGATSQVGFSDDSEAEAFGQLIWDMFLGGKSDIRPLGSVPLDGIDLDIEKGSSAHYAAMVNKIRSLAKGASKRYYITAAPQCPFPDEYIGTALNNAFFDAVYVQFYNNYCETSVPSEFNFDTWDKWAKNQSPNGDIKVYLGAPGDSSAAGDGYVNIETLSKVATDAQGRYSSFGGVMLWDADAAYTNNRYDRAIKNALIGGTASVTNTETGTVTRTTTSEVITTSKAITTPLPKLILPFQDPRKTARVKRPQGVSLVPREVAPTARAQGRSVISRVFRF